MINTIKFEKYKYPIILGLLSQLLIILVSIISSKIIGEEDSIGVTLFTPSVLTIIILFLFKKKEVNYLKWYDFNVVSLINVIISSVILLLWVVLFYDLDEKYFLFFIFSFVINLIPTVIVGIFLEKGPIGLKLKRLLSVILFVWAIYKLFTSFSNSDESETKSNGVDTDGDGVSDTFDTNGDGVMDTSYVDTDGDGISDTIAMDSDGDGLVDTVFSDSNGDGKIDSFIKDTDRDGISDIVVIDTDGDRRLDKLV
jgi:hypothetical protein